MSFTAEDPPAPDPQSGSGGDSRPADGSGKKSRKNPQKKHGSRTTPGYRVFGEDSQYVGELSEQVEALIELERLERQLLATRFEVLAEIERVAAREAARDNFPVIETEADASETRAAKAPASGLETGARAVLRAASNDPRDTLAHRAARAEVATALKLTEYTVDQHLVRAAKLTSQYPNTVEVLKRGEISRMHATILLDVGALVGHEGIEDTPEIAERRAAFEAAALEQAVKMTPNRFRKYLEQLVEQYASVDLDTRFASEWQNRNVYVRPVGDGMAEVRAYLAAVDAMAIEDRLTKIASRIVQVECGEAEGEQGNAAITKASRADVPRADVPRRSVGEARADLFTDFLLNCTADTVGVGSEITGEIHIVTHDSLLLEKLRSVDHGVKSMQKSTGNNAQLFPTTGQGRQGPLRELFPELRGYGPIPAVSMLKILDSRTAKGAPASWNVLIAHPETGDLMEVHRYQPSEAMRRFIAARDVHCRFPGCRMPVHRCEIDHTIDAALGGKTSITNLGALCVSHHTLKHHSGWKVKQHAYGIYEWTSPTGITHIDEPVSRVIFRKAHTYEERAEDSRAGPPDASRQSDASREAAANRQDDTQHPF